MAEAAVESAPAPRFTVAPSPHIPATGMATRGMMLDVLIALLPALAVGVYIFRWAAVAVVGLCVLSSLFAEFVFMKLGGKKATLGDFSAVVTGVILALSLPWVIVDSWYVAVVASFIAVGIGKVAFGGLGMNIFNPAMVGRAFVMIAFAKVFSGSAYVVEKGTEVAAGMADAVTSATPLSLIQEAATKLAEGKTAAAQALMEQMPNSWQLFAGFNINGSIGETSGIAILIGGLYLCLKRTASWEIPVGMILSTLVFGGLCNVLGLSDLMAYDHVLAGSLLFGAFFIATDPVSSPLTPKGKWIFGIGIGAVVILLRVFSSYPEGVMFAVLLMNATVPLINRMSIPTPLGGPVPAKK